jgi:hypothetical protein
VLILPPIRVKVNLVKGLSSSLIQNSVKVSNVKSGVSTVRASLAPQIRGRRNINLRLNHAHNSALVLEKRLRDLETVLISSLDRYCRADDYVNRLGPRYGINVASKDSNFKSVVYTEGKVKLKSLGKIAFGRQIATGKAAVQTVKGISKVYSFVKGKIQPGGDWYKPYQIGKAVVGIGVGVATVVGSGALAVFSGGTASPMAVVTAIYGANEVVNSLYNLWHACNGNYDKIDTVNALKTIAGTTGGIIGSAAGNEEMGRKIGEGAYYVGGVATIVKGGYDAVQDIKKMNSITKSDIIKEAKAFKPEATSMYKNAVGDLGKVRGVEQLKQVMSVDTLKDLKNVKKVSDISSVRGVQTLTEVQYWNTIKTSYKVIASEPIKKLIISNSSIVTGVKGIKGIKDVAFLPFEGWSLYKDVRDNYTR